ncbi:MAG: hypothetical protein ACJZ8O_12995 [Pirellulaceae bacterium]
MSSLAKDFTSQQFSNGYEVVDGVQMNAENPEFFHIPPDVLKYRIQVGYFLELRVDSPRFSVHEGADDSCTCTVCNGEATKPILSHDHPASLIPLPTQDIPSRGWGEDFWIQVVDLEETTIKGRVDNPLAETRLHGIQQNSEILCTLNHVLAIHPSHRLDMVSSMTPEQVKELTAWLASLRSE